MSSELTRRLSALVGPLQASGFGVLCMALARTLPTLKGYWGVGNSQKFLFSELFGLGLTAKWDFAVRRVLVRSNCLPETPLVGYATTAGVRIVEQELGINDRALHGGGTRGAGTGGT